MRDWALLLGAAVIGVIGATDYLTGKELNLAAFYLVPIAAASWYRGRKAGLATSLGCALVGGWVDELLLSERAYHVGYVVFNHLMEYARFLIVALLVAKVHETLLHALDRERRRAAAESELRAFTYAIAHHLRAPLRAIKAGAGDLLAAASPETPAAAAAFARVASRTDRMAGLVEGLLAMARIGEVELARRPFDVAAEARLVWDEISSRRPERSVELRVGVLPMAAADPALARLLLRVLLENAWKFTGPSPHPVVEVGADARVPPAYFVRDNGVGFDVRHSARLFAPFERLHAREEFPGLGLGLALAHRVVARHEGRIWAESELGRGACFRFTLEPKAADR